MKLTVLYGDSKITDRKINYNALWLARNAEGLSLEELSAKAGIELSILSKIELGVTTLASEEILEKLSAILKVPVDFFCDLSAEVYLPALHYGLHR